MKIETIICSAIWYDDGKNRLNLPTNIESGIVVSGWRHFNCIPQLIETLCPNWMTDEQHHMRHQHMKRNWIQGFLTSTGRFVDRIEGAEVAMLSGQKLVRKDTVTYLYSEDIY